MLIYKRKISAAAFIGLLILPLLILLAVQTVLWQMKQAPFQRLREKEQHTITLRKAAVVWEEKGRELIIDGCYFDILSFRQEGENLVVTGYFDHEEAGIATWLRKMIANHKTKQGLVRLLLLLQSLVFFSTEIVELTVLNLSAAPGSLYSNQYTPPFLHHPSPPPWF